MRCREMEGVILCDYLPTIGRFEVPEKIKHQNRTRDEIVKIFHRREYRKTMFARYVCNYPGKISKESDQTNPQTEHWHAKESIRTLIQQYGNVNALTVLFVITAIVQNFSTANDSHIHCSIRFMKPIVFCLYPL